MAELLPMILSVGLFFLTLVIIITLRNSDRNEHRLEQVKRYVGSHLEMLKTKDNELLAHISEYESRFIEAQNQAAAMISEIEDKREHLFSHVKELIELEATVVHYHEVLTDLSTLTLQAEQRITYVQEQVDRLKAVEQLIDRYREEVSESEENLDQIEESVHQRISLFEQRVDSYAAGVLESTETRLSEQRQEFIGTMDPLLGRVRSLIIPLFDRISVHVDSLTDRQQEFSQSMIGALDEASMRITRMKEDEHYILEQVDELSRRKSALAHDLKHLEGELADRGRELEEASARVATQRQELATVEDEVLRGLVELDTMSSQVARTRENLDQLSQEVVEGNRSLKTLDEQLEQMSEQTRLAQQEKARVEEDLETGRADLDDITGRIEASHEVNQQLLDEKARIEQDIEEALRIQKEMREQEELLSMRERERIDYPDSDFEEDALSAEEEELVAPEEPFVEPDVPGENAYEEDPSALLLFEEEQDEPDEKTSSPAEAQKPAEAPDLPEDDEEEVVVTFDEDDERV